MLVTVGAWETETVAGQVAAAHHQRKVRLSHAPLLPPLKPRWRGERGAFRPPHLSAALSSKGAMEPGVHRLFMMVTGAAVDRIGAVDLLAQNEACHLMREGHRREGEYRIRASLHRLGKTIGAPNHKVCRTPL